MPPFSRSHSAQAPFWSPSRPLSAPFSRSQLSQRSSRKGGTASQFLPSESGSQLEIVSEDGIADSTITSLTRFSQFSTATAPLAEPSSTASLPTSMASASAAANAGASGVDVGAVVRRGGGGAGGSVSDGCLHGEGTAGPKEKDWHVSDEKLMEMVQILLLTQQTQQPTSASETGCSEPRGGLRPPALTKTSSSCMCRAMLGVGRVKKGQELNASSSSPQLRLSQDRTGSTSGTALGDGRGTAGPSRSPLRPSSAAASGRRRQGPAGAAMAGAVAPGAAIEVHLYFHEMSDAATVRVDPDLHLGPDTSASGIIESTSSDFGASRTPLWKSSLKGLIQDLSGITVEKQRLFCNKSRVEGDDQTLRDCGIAHGSTVRIRAKKDLSCMARDKVTLACTAKRQERDKHWEQQERHRRQHVQKDGGNRRVGDGAVVMPQWQPSSHLNYFGPTHKGLDFHGDSRAPVHMFGDYHTWRPVENDRNFARVRQTSAYTTPIEYEVG
mmetsp:Transcript_13036/g.46354  ORF Transcript_13036/g.46354 Transcript_13036/m.46354 type:complete len:497 (-) Transcript_13036:71-1561(-)